MNESDARSVFHFSETNICYREYFNLNCYIGKIVQKKFAYGFKNLVKLGVWHFFFFSKPQNLTQNHH